MFPFCEAFVNQGDLAVPFGGSAVRGLPRFIELFACAAPDNPNDLRFETLDCLGQLNIVIAGLRALFRTSALRIHLIHQKHVHVN